MPPSPELVEHSRSTICLWRRSELAPGARGESQVRAVGGSGCETVTGDVGTALGRAFAGVGHDVVYGAHSPHSDAARSAVEQIPGASVDVDRRGYGPGRDTGARRAVGGSPLD